MKRLTCTRQTAMLDTGDREVMHASQQAAKLILARVAELSAPKLATLAGQGVSRVRAVPPKLKTRPVTDEDVKGWMGG